MMTEERFDSVMSTQQKIAGEVNSKFIGKEIAVLIEEKQKGCYIGRSQADAPEVDGTVFVNTEKSLKAGEIIRVRITDTLEYDLVGEPT